MSGKNRNRGYRGQKRHNNQPTLASVAGEVAVSFAADSPVLAMFRQAAVQLNNRQDKHERLVKLSRDITIESKRIIFLLHSAITEEDITQILNEAKERLQKLTAGPIKSVGLELENSPAYLHSKAITAGFQEFIEALALFSVMETKNIITYSDVVKELTYTVKNSEGEDRTVVTLLPPMDYMLGLADLTGELMRRAINSIASGHSEHCIDSCQIVRDMYTGYLGLYGIGKPLSSKMRVTRSNVFKVEQAVYALHIRGGEAPPSLILPSTPVEEYEYNMSDEDEGLYI